jgi:hypothetical protein
MLAARCQDGSVAHGLPIATRSFLFCLEASAMIPDLIAALNRPAQPRAAFLGLDGFVDEIIHVVDQRISPTRYERIRKIEDYAARIARASALSTNIELVSLQTKMGGNGPILANALLNYGVAVTYMGSVGAPDLNPLMAPLRRCKRCIGLGQPAHTDALEFEDGKIITSKLAALDAITWEAIRGCLAPQELAGLVQASDLFGFSNWSMILGMNAIWRGFLEEVAPLLNPAGKIAFFDLADPEKRTQADLAQALSLIRAFSAAGFQGVLSMNLKEAGEIGAALGVCAPQPQAAGDAALLRAIQQALGIETVVIHRQERAACRMGERFTEVQGPYCAAPVITTGAEDHFNAGFLYGLLQGFAEADCLLSGCATSGYYVRNASSPTICALRAFLSAWDQNRLDGDHGHRPI